MKEKGFNLLDEPWIRVLLPDCSVREVSLTDALIHAHEYQDLAGETPAQDVAVLRLLLAVLHTVFSRVDENGEPSPLERPKQAVKRWEHLWTAGKLPEHPIREYLQTWHERFWLFHPERPFYQVPEASVGTSYGSAKLNGEVSESGNKLRLFSKYTGQGKEKLSFAQAARWLLYVNAYDDTSAKPKGKNLPSPGAGWPGKLGLILVQGKTLFETLLLNLTMLKDGQEVWEAQKPCWELENTRASERVQIALPDNPAELLTLQSRRLLLKKEDESVIGFTLLGGDFFEKENAFSEQMTVWRQAKAGKNTPVTYVPARHDPNKQLWREFPVIFLGDQENHRPGIVRWITALQKEGIINSKKYVHFKIVSVKYGDKDFFVSDSFADSLTFHVQLLDDFGLTWRNYIKAEIERCEKLAVQVKILAKNLSLASGNDAVSSQTQGKQQNASSEFFFRIDAPFRKWIETINPEWSQEETRKSLDDWQVQALRISRELGRQIVEEAGPAALVGRTIKNEKTDKLTHYSAPEAYNHFLYGIKKIYE